MGRISILAKHRISKQFKEELFKSSNNQRKKIQSRAFRCRQCWVDSVVYFYLRPVSLDGYSFLTYTWFSQNCQYISSHSWRDVHVERTPPLELGSFHHLDNPLCAFLGVVSVSPLRRLLKNCLRRLLKHRKLVSENYLDKVVDSICDVVTDNFSELRHFLIGEDVFDGNLIPVLIVSLCWTKICRR